MGDIGSGAMLSGGQGQYTSGQEGAEGSGTGVGSGLGQGSDQGVDPQFDVWAQEGSKGAMYGDTADGAHGFDFDLHEGAVDEVVVQAYSDVVKELNLPHEQAQAVIDRVLPVMQQQQQEVLAKARTDWVQAARSDREFGGERLGESLSIAKKAMETFGSPELRELLDTSGLGNHPEIIRAFYRAGKGLHQDRVVTGGRGVLGKSEPMERKLYPNM